MVGSIENYLTYSYTLIFISSGGGNYVASFSLAIMTSIMLIVGGGIIKYVPIIIIGVLLSNIGFSLIKGYLIDTIGVLTPFEYITVWLIIIIMNIVGFIEGVFSKLVYFWLILILF